MDLTSHDILGISLEWMMWALKNSNVDIFNIVPSKRFKGSIEMFTTVGIYFFKQRINSFECVGYEQTIIARDAKPSMYTW
ncbi:MAG: hypothetical protein J6S85_05065 [Methanobrevibacter sp.]|nr:hypothetical protein [Methanobrevibacter sp.]